MSVEYNIHIYWIVRKIKLDLFRRYSQIFRNNKQFLLSSFFLLLLISGVRGSYIAVKQ